MRNTGVRIGELIRLEYSCLRSDPRGNAFVKVPLGKLNNDRLVPVDVETAGLVEKLQGIDRSQRLWLLPMPPAPSNMPQTRRIDRRGSPTHTTYHSLYERLRRALRHACKGIDIGGRMTSHRLRHTYATTLLSGGMSLVGLMKLLGHRSYTTTLRYAAVTQETIGKQYFEALHELEKRYQLQLHRSDAAEPDPLQMLSDVARWIDKHVAHDQEQPRTARRLTKRIERVRYELQQLLPQADGS
jgi:integrase